MERACLDAWSSKCFRDECLLINDAMGDERDDVRREERTLRDMYDLKHCCSGVVLSSSGVL